MTKNRRLNSKYLSRNIDLCVAVGLKAALVNALTRMSARQDCPLWLIKTLSDCVDKSNTVIRTARNYRDEQLAYLPNSATKAREGNDGEQLSFANF